MKSFFFAAWEILEVVIIAVLVVLGVRALLVQPFLVSGSSMEPTFQNGDYILINEISYRFRAPERGEVVVFRFPQNESVFYIKRIIGLPGERVVVKNGEIKIFNQNHPEGFSLGENYLSIPMRKTDEKNISLKDGEYFMMGDNRNASSDSRQWGPAKKSEIIGEVWMRLWPLNKVMAFEKPAY